jgi:hypothetical protein
MSLLPLFRPILERGVKAPKAATDPILLADSSWTTIHVFFDTVHVADIVLDVEGVDFCYEEGGPMEIDPRCNIVLYAAMRVLSEMGDSDMGPLPD